MRKAADLHRDRCNLPDKANDIAGKIIGIYF